MSKYTLENNKGLLDEIYPDRLWANNLGIVIRWLDESYLLKMKDKDIYYLDVDHPYVAHFIKIWIRYSSTCIIMH